MINLTVMTTAQLIKLHMQIGTKIFTRLWWVWVLFVVLFVAGMFVLNRIDRKLKS